MEVRQRSYVGISLLFIFVCMAFIYGNQATKTLGSETDGLDLLQGAFQKSGAHFEQYTVSGWVNLNEQLVNVLTLRGYGKTATDRMEVELGKLNWTETSRVDDGISVLTLAGKSKSGVTVVLELQSIHYKNTDTLPRAETFALISLKSELNCQDLIRSKELVQKALEFAAGSQGTEKVHISTVMQGSYPGKLTGEERKIKVSRIFEQLDADLVEGINTESLLSWSGYTPLLTDVLKVGNQTINLNAASRYSPSTQKTLLFVATPIISTEY